MTSALACRWPDLRIWLHDVTDILMHMQVSGDAAQQPDGTAAAEVRPERGG